MTSRAQLSLTSLGCDVKSPCHSPGSGASTTSIAHYGAATFSQSYWSTRRHSQGVGPVLAHRGYIPPPTVVSLTAAGSVTAFDRRPTVDGDCASSLARSRPLWKNLVWLRQPETVPLSLGTPRDTSAVPGTS